MTKKPPCFGAFMQNIGNPNCDICPLATDCYNEWQRRDQQKKKLQEYEETPWYKRKAFKEMFPEACEQCEKT